MIDCMVNPAPVFMGLEESVAPAGGGGGGAVPAFTEDWESGSKDTNWTLYNDSADATIVESEGDNILRHANPGGVGDRLFGAVNDIDHADADEITIDLRAIPDGASGQGMFDVFFLSAAAPDFGGNSASGAPRYYMQLVNSSGSPVMQLRKRTASADSQVGGNAAYAAGKKYKIAWTVENGSGARTFTITEDPDGAATVMINETDIVPDGLGTKWGFYNQCNSGQSRTVDVGDITLKNGAA